jgi:predicted RNase H-like nuclease
MRVAGVDVWKGRWVAVVLEDGRYDDALVAKELDSLLDDLAGATAIGVDMPLGLPLGAAARHADAAARTFVGPRRASSVFSTYPRSVYLADRHGAATIIVPTAQSIAPRRPARVAMKRTDSSAPIVPTAKIA